MKQTDPHATARHVKLVQCPTCNRSLPQLPGMVCASCLRKLMDARREASVLKTPEERLDASTHRVMPQNERTGQAGRYGLSWFELVCYVGGIAVLAGYLISDFYFTLTLVITMVLLIVTLFIEAIKIR
jgi:hypothetical protein